MNRHVLHVQRAEIDTPKNQKAKKNSAHSLVFIKCKILVIRTSAILPHSSVLSLCLKRLLLSGAQICICLSSFDIKCYVSGPLCFHFHF